jgi:hypothetical protein
MSVVRSFVHAILVFVFLLRFYELFSRINGREKEREREEKREKESIRKREGERDLKLGGKLN